MEADAVAFLERAADWFAEWPTLAVVKLTNAGGLLPELAACPWIAHLRGLDLGGNGIDASALAHLTSSRFVGLLRALDLSGNPIGPTGAALLAGSRSMDDLEELHLMQCGLCHEGLVSLLAGPARWRRLDLSANGLSRLGMLRLADSPLMRRLESLNLACNPLSDEGTAALAGSPNAAGLVDLGLYSTGTGDSGVAALAASRSLTSLRSLDLRWHQCGWSSDPSGMDTGGIADLARSPMLGRLGRLLLGDGGGADNGWTTRVLGCVRPSQVVERGRGGWVATLLRSSNHLRPSELTECDLEELWWLGDTANRDRPVADPWRVVGWVERFPELLNDLGECQAAVVRMRYGLDGERKARDEIAAALGRGRDEVARLEKEGVRKLETLAARIPGELWDW